MDATEDTENTEVQEAIGRGKIGAERIDAFTLFFTSRRESL
jgi:hypothetical protein